MRELVDSCETWSTIEDTFEFNKVIYKENGHLFQATTTERVFDVNNLVGTHIPIESLNPVIPNDLKEFVIAPTPPPENSYIKSIDYLRYDPDDPSL